LSIIGLLDTPTDGRYLLDGKPVQNLKAAERARIRNRDIGFVFQAFNLIGDLTVYENVELPLTYRGMASATRKKGERRSRTRDGAPTKHFLPALGRPAAAGRGRARGGGRALHSPRRRAHG
jgi:ABC-type lipoprotein export system ATPase subunit